MVRDLRLRAQEIGDVETLQSEERKREGWKWENELRRHNFVGFAHQMLKQVVRVKNKEGKYDEWIQEARQKSQKRIEDRMKGKQTGDEMEVEY